MTKHQRKQSHDTYYLFFTLYHPDYDYCYGSNKRVEQLHEWTTPTTAGLTEESDNHKLAAITCRSYHHNELWPKELKKGAREQKQTIALIKILWLLYIPRLATKRLDKLQRNFLWVRQLWSWLLRVSCGDLETSKKAHFQGHKVGDS